jgi:hypothetical protein
VYAAAHVERLVERDADTMIWMDPESLVLAPPDGLVLPRGAAVALQPVFLLNKVGVPAGEAFPPYWKRILDEVGVDPATVPTVHAVVDDRPIRFYVNCGVIAYRPSRRLGEGWARALTALLSDPAYRALATADGPHAVFLHQAVLSAVLCARTRPSERRWIPISHGYPLNLADRVPAAKKVARLNDVVCLLYDNAWDQDPGWLSRVPVDEPLRGWLVESHRSLYRLTDRLSREEADCNTYLVNTGDGWVAIDPGSPRGTLRELAATAPLHAILLTHAHPDHRNGIAAWTRGADVPVVGHRRNVELLADQDRIAGLLARRNAVLS